jgi:hypothetical protein
LAAGKGGDREYLNGTVVLTGCMARLSAKPGRSVDRLWNNCFMIHIGCCSVTRPITEADVRRADEK